MSEDELRELAETWREEADHKWTDPETAKTMHRMASELEELLEGDDE